MVLRTLHVYPGASEQFRLPLGDSVSWQIRVREGYDVNLEIKIAPALERRPSGESATQQQPGFAVTLPDGRSVKLKDRGSRVLEEKRRAAEFKGQLVLADLQDAQCPLSKEEWDMVFVFDNGYSYFTKKQVDLEVMIEGANAPVPASGIHMPPTGAAQTAPTAPTAPTARSTATREAAQVAAPEAATAPTAAEANAVRAGDNPLGDGLSADTPRTNGVHEGPSHTRNLRDSLFSEDDPEIARCLRAKAQVDFVWMRCMLKDAVRRCPPDATDLRNMFIETQKCCERYIDRQFLVD